jgi:NADH-quinone oxidoreductase subunit N
MKEILTLSLTGVFIMLADMLNIRRVSFLLVLLGLATTMTFCIYDWGINQGVYGMMRFDKYANAFTLVMCGAAFLWLLMSEDYFSKMAVSTDRYALVMFILAGGFLMLSFTNLVVLFLGIEILSVSLYVLAGSNKSDISSNEAALKYFLMGAFASGFLLFGMALIYGYTGNLDLERVRTALAEKYATEGINPMVTIGSLMMLIGMGFKISAAPFHFWAPDVYQGAPTPITAFMATIVKMVAFAALYHLFAHYLAPAMGAWGDVVVAMSILTLLIGNVSAVMQTDAKRMLAYSSISHAGYMLLAVLSANKDSDNSILFYTAAYSVATILGFLVLYIVSENTGSTSVSAFNGLGKKNPLLAGAMTLSLLSMAGIPPLSGFMAKYFIFVNAVSQGYLLLVLFAIAMSLVGVYYYFKIIIAMYFTENEGNTEGGKFQTDVLQNVLIAISCVALLVLGIFPQLVYNLL